MINFNKKLFVVLLLFLSLIQNINAEVIYNENSVDIQAVEATQNSKYPDYAKIFAGDDKFEKFNRKMFNLNRKLNKFVARPIHIVWSSIMPKYGMDRIKDAYNNIEYPKRLASCILQRDGQGIKTETLRFLTNTTIGLGGLYDPADKIFKIRPTHENMEQALCKCKMNSGSYLVVPCLNSCTPRSLCGRALEAALDPSVYLATPIVSAIKFGLMLNRTSYMQPLAKMIETTYADPYDIHKKLFGLENYIRNSNYDREGFNIIKETYLKEVENKTQNFSITGAASEINELSDILPLGKNALTNINDDISPDIILDGYKIQTPVVDSMKTVFFEDKNVNKSIWNDLSLWNRSFAKRIKTASVSVEGGKEEYKFKYILQKDKTSPVVILYPSIGEGAGAHHSLIFAKMFYDEGYSVIMQGSHFHWEFVKSMPDGFCPGLPFKDSLYIREVTSKALSYLSEKYSLNPKEKVIIGTSFGAVATLFVAQKESENSILGINKFIAISPPIELQYALKRLDENSDSKEVSYQDIKDKTALTAAKVLELYELKDDKNFSPESLPFSEEEGKLISSFILRQKLSDIIFTIENEPKDTKSDLYEMINNMSYKDYAEKYLGMTFNDNLISKDGTSLFSIEDYLKNNDNYVIYHSLDDYFINKEQIAKLKKISGNKLICLNCGAHLGFLSRKEFCDSLKKVILGG